MALLLTALPLAAADPPLYTEAVRLVQEQNWSEAIGRIDELLSLYPGNAKILNLRGLALMGNGNAAAAQASFRLALRSHPKFLPALKNAAILEWNNHLSDAVADTESALELSPRDPVLNAYGALAAWQKQDRSQAVSRFELAGTAISLLPSEEEAKLGFLFGSQGYYGQAERVFLDLMSRGQSTSATRYNLGLAQYLNNQNEDAIRTLEDRRSFPVTSESLNLLAQAYVKDGQPQKANDALREAIATDPADESNYLDLSNLCIDNGLYVEADRVVQTGLERLPRSAKLNFEAGLIRSLSRKFDQANQFFEKAMTLEPNGDLPRAAVELVQIEQSKLPEAIHGLRQKLNVDGRSALLWYFLGVALNREGAAVGTPEYNEAEQAFRKAIQLDPKLPFPYLELAKTYARTNRAPAAVPLLQQAMTFPALRRSAAYQLATVYRQTNQPQLAKEMLNKIRGSEEQSRTSGKFQPNAGAKPSDEHH